MTLFGQDRIFSTAETQLAAAPAAAAELAVLHTRSTILRFANNGITQSSDEDLTQCFARVLDGGRQGAAKTDALDAGPVGAAFARATDFARQSPNAAHAMPLPTPATAGAVPEKVPPTYFDATAALSPRAMTGLLGKLFDQARARDVEVAGVLIATAGEFAVANTTGLRRYFPGTLVTLKVIARGKGDATGYAEGMHRDGSFLPFDALAAKAIGDAARGGSAERLEPGEYDVVIEPPAVGEVLHWLGFTSFTSRAVEQQSSLLTAGPAGSRLVNERISIYDNGLEATRDAIVTPFDFEGVAKQRVSLIDRGRAGSPVHNTASALRCGCASTGHQTQPGDFGGEESPENLYVGAGADTVDEMIKSIKRGIYIPRFHYVNGYLNPKQGLMTGMTREGAALIENGRVTRPIKKLRWTQSFVDALNNVRMVGRERAAHAHGHHFFGAATAPAMLIPRFRFTGVSGE